MTNQLEEELKTVIIDTLALEDITPSDIDSDAPLFGEGLSLDSIDALELALAVHSKFGVKTEENDPMNPEYYHSVKSLAQFIVERRAAMDAAAAEVKADPATVEQE